MANDLEALAKSVEGEPENAGYRMDFGTALAEDGQLVKAAEQLEKAIELDPAMAKAHYNLGVIFGRVLLDDLAVDELWEDHTDEEAYFEKASACYKEAIKLDPNMTAALNNLARLCDAMGLHHEAKKHFESSLKIDGDQPDVKSDLASLIERDDFSEPEKPAPEVGEEDLVEEDE